MLVDLTCDSDEEGAPPAPGQCSNNPDPDHFGISIMLDDEDTPPACTAATTSNILDRLALLTGQPPVLPGAPAAVPACPAPRPAASKPAAAAGTSAPKRSAPPPVPHVQHDPLSAVGPLDQSTWARKSPPAAKRRKVTGGLPPLPGNSDDDDDDDCLMALRALSGEDASPLPDGAPGRSRGQGAGPSSSVGAAPGLLDVEGREEEEDRGGVPLTRQEVAAAKKAAKAREKAAAKAAKDAAKAAERAEKVRLREEAKAAERADKAAAREAKKASEQLEGVRKAAERETASRAKGGKADKDIIAVIDSRMDPLLRAAVAQMLQSRCLRHREEELALPLPAVVWRRQLPSALQHAHSACRRTGRPALPATDGAPGEVEVELPYVLLVYPSQERFIADVQGGGAGLAAVVAQCKASGLGDCSLGVMCVGLAHWLCLAERRQGVLQGPESGARVSKAAVDRAVAAALVVHPQLRIRTTDKGWLEAADHVVALTASLAAQPYKNTEPFLECFGGKKGGTGAMDDDLGESSREVKSCCHALARVKGVQPKAAVAIAMKYKSLSSLLAAYNDPARTEAERRKLLVGLGQHGGTRNIGGCMSGKLFSLLTADDPHVQLSNT